jgi:ribose 5-phosphate isomerase A
MFGKTNKRDKQLVADAAIEYVKNHDIIGVGTGSTTNYFIEALAKRATHLEGAVASSLATEKLLKKHRIPVLDLNSVGELPVYVDGADAFVDHGYLLKGGGGALTREKICAAAAKQFICIADGSKRQEVLGNFPVVVEVIPMARSLVARALVALGANPVYRTGYKTDNGNVIIDAHDLDLTDPIAMAQTLNNITGVVAHGLFAKLSADVILTTNNHTLETIKYL